MRDVLLNIAEESSVYKLILRLKKKNFYNEQTFNYQFQMHNGLIHYYRRTRYLLKFKWCLGKPKNVERNYSADG